jgi:16S rRNA (guanine1516-N2)-methyltransferase
MSSGLLVALVLLWRLRIGTSFAIQQRPTEVSTDRQVCFIDDDFEAEAQALASKLSVPISSQTTDDVAGFSHALRLVPFESGDIATYALAIEHLEYVGSGQSKRRKPKRKPKSNPFYVDLCPPQSSRTGMRGPGPDLLVKAVAPKRSALEGQDGAVVYDLTAGFGQDSLVLAMSGASRVCMVERDPIVAALLDDGLRRLKLQESQTELASYLSARLSLKAGEGLEVVHAMMKSEEVPRADVVYLDPMFPPRTKSSAVKKGMQILHGLLDTQQSDDESVKERLLEESRLLGAALQAARVRVVVKRPLRALPLGGDGSNAPRPSYAVEGSVNRWDVYVNNESSNLNS